MSYVHYPGLAGEYASAPDITAYNIGATVFVGGFVAADDWTPSAGKTVIGQSTASGNQRSYALKIAITGELQATVSDDGIVVETVTGDTATGFTGGTAHWVGMSFDAGALKFWDGGTDIDNPVWVQLGGDETTTAVTLHNSTGLMEVGSVNAGATQQFSGGMYRAVVYSDIARTTPVFDADFTKLTAADLEAGSFTEDSVNAATVTLNGDEWTYVPLIPQSGILGTMEAVWMAGDGNKGFSPKWADRSGNDHHAQNGSAAGGDTNDCLFKPFDGTKYAFMPGTADNWFSAVDDAAYDLDDSFFLSAYVAAVDWTPAAVMHVVGQWSAAGDQRAYSLGVTAAGALVMLASDDGTTNESVVSSVGHGFADGTGHWIGCDFNGGVVQFFDGGTDLEAPSWSELGTDQTFATVTSCHDSTAVLEIGSLNLGQGSNFEGDIYKVVMYSDTTPTTAVFDADIRDATSPFATFAERVSGNTVTINRSATGYRTTIVTSDRWLLSTDNSMESDTFPAIGAGDDLTLTVFGMIEDAATTMILAATKTVNTTDLGYELSLFSSDVRGTVGDGTLGAADTISEPAVNTEFVATLVRNVTDDDIEMFLDGVGSGSPTTDPTTTTIDSGNPLTFGKDGGAGAWYMEGSIMAVTASLNPLTDEEVLQLSNELLGVGGGELMLMGVG